MILNRFIWDISRLLRRLLQCNMARYITFNMRVNKICSFEVWARISRTQGVKWGIIIIRDDTIFTCPRTYNSRGNEIKIWYFENILNRYQSRNFSIFRWRYPSWKVYLQLRLKLYPFMIHIYSKWIRNMYFTVHRMSQLHTHTLT